MSYVPSNTIRTAEQLWKLKRQWASDPCWDIETTEGYELHYAELLEYRLLCEVRWNMAREERIAAYAAKIGAGKRLAEYVMGLENRIEALENRGKETR